jgi:hypothetical protein
MLPEARTPNPRQRASLFDIHPQTGASIEVFYADRSLETFGRSGAGWFWWPRRRGFAPQGPVVGPFPTTFSAYRDALVRRTDPTQFGMTSPGEGCAQQPDQARARTLPDR